MTVARLECPSCETVILAKYRLNCLSRLPTESQSFIEHFVRYRGNLKEMERESGVSYWALRNQLDDVIGQLGYTVPDEEAAAAETMRREVLARLSRGEIDIQTAADQIMNQES